MSISRSQKSKSHPPCETETNSSLLDQAGSTEQSGQGSQSYRASKAQYMKRRAAYAFGNLGQSAFYNALSTYFVV